MSSPEHISGAPRMGTEAKAGYVHKRRSSASLQPLGPVFRLYAYILRRRRYALVVALFVAIVCIVSERFTRQRDDIQSRVEAMSTTKYSIIVSTYKRAAHLQSFLDNYAMGDLARLAAVHVAWGLGDIDPPDWLTAHNYRVPVTFERAKVNSLTERFRLPSTLSTRAVLAIDDDLRFDPKDIEFAFSVWQQFGLNASRIVGFSPRDWNIDANGEYHYQNLRLWRYSMILTNACFMDAKFLHWFFEPDQRTVKSIEYVDKEMNCEDILMNFVVSARTGNAPLYVRGHPINVASAGLSQLQGHYDARTYCMREFIKWWGMPLVRTDFTLRRGALDIVKVKALETEHDVPEYVEWGNDLDFAPPRT